MIKRVPISSRWLAFLGGAGLFLLVQGLLLLAAVPVEGGGYSGWFLNSGHGIAAVAIAFAATGAMIGFRRRDRVREAAMVVGGALLAMIAVLVGLGPGNLFPIVLVFAIAVIAGATAAGTAIAIELRPEERRDQASQ